MTTFAYRSRNVTMVGEIYDSRLHQMAADWAAAKGREIEKVAKANLVATGSIRTGHLYASIHNRRRKQVGGFTTVRVYAGANYAAYVHEGTYGPIVPKNGPFLWVPRSKRTNLGALRVRRAWVHGQDANPFLSDAMFEVLVATQMKLF